MANGVVLLFQEMKFRLSKLVAVLGMVNFVAFLVGTAYFGGDAVSGKVVDGHYFLSSHGRLTEVSAAVFTYSWLHTWSVFASWPFVLLCGWLSSRKESPE